MKRCLLIAAAALALAACGREDAKAPAAPGVTELSSPRLSGRLYACDLTYVAVRGPVVQQSRAMVRMGVDTSGVTPGWKVESVTVLEPLPDADGFDPWLSFLPGIQRQFVAQDGAVLTLDMLEGAPVTLNTQTGDLDWSVAGMLGETEYTGGCV